MFLLDGFNEAGTGKGGLIQEIEELGGKDSVGILVSGRIDFGAARDFTGNRELTAVLKGNFAPFEQFRSEKQGPWTDIYALSATLYFAMGGKLPVKATDRMVALAYGEKDPLLPIQALCPDLPPHVAKTLNWGMEVTAKQRPQPVFHDV